jgi:hypothetical protein
MEKIINNETPVAMLTAGELKQVLKDVQPEQAIEEKKEKRVVYGIPGIAKIFDCSIPTAQRIKSSGKIDRAITQPGRKIIVDANLAVELAGKKEGGRKPKYFK